MSIPLRSLCHVYSRLLFQAFFHRSKYTASMFGFNLTHADKQDIRAGYNLRHHIYQQIDAGIFIKSMELLGAAAG